MQSQLSICTLVASSELLDELRSQLDSERFLLIEFKTDRELLNRVMDNQEPVDCVIIERKSVLQPVINHLYELGILLPVVILENNEEILSSDKGEDFYLYHPAEVRQLKNELQDMGDLIEKAIAQFLTLVPTSRVPMLMYQIKDNYSKNPEGGPNEVAQNFLAIQQHRLSGKLKERLGYLGVYYKRNPKYFYRNLSANERQELIKRLKFDYRQIVLNYFSEEDNLNPKIDDFVNTAFFSDIPISQIVEIHMELMEDFSQQLKLEGRNEELLLDYRLTLIDIIAHLCEMYRRSIPREI